MTGATDAGTVLAMPADVVENINTALGWMLGLVAVACVGKIIFVGARMAWDHQHTPGVESPVSAEFFAAVIGWILAAVAAGGIAAALLDATGTVSNDPQPNPSVDDDIERIHPPLKGGQ